MARKTFGRSGQVIIVPDESVGSTVRIIEAESSGDVDTPTEDNITGDGESPAFDAVGPVIRTEPISDPGSGTSYTDPTTAAGPRLNKDGTPRKRRGEGKVAGEKQDKNVITANLEKVLFSLHTMAAGMLSEPEFNIDEDESKLLAQAVEKVANAYNWTTVLSPKMQAALDMTIVLATVYGPRVVRIAKKHRTRPMRNVTPITQTGTEKQ